jgi:hypothetical protein
LRWRGIGKKRAGRDAELPMAHDLELDGRPGAVAGWRMERLVAAGFDRRVAFDFAHDGRVDLHELLDLVDRGCPPELAARIRAPLGYRGGLG